jgi:hypothetical protein
MPQHRPLLLAETTAFSTLFVALLCGLVFGATTALLPFLKFNAMVLIAALIFLFLAHMRMRGGILLGLPVALLSAVVSVVAMWALWFGFEYGFGTLWSLVQQGPKAVSSTIRRLAATTSVSVRMSGGTTSTHGPDEVRLVWMIETASMAAAPVLGALASPFARRWPARA